MPRSRRPPEPPPEVFVDRSLGRYLIPDALRAAGYAVHTMFTVYGAGAEESVTDEEWLERAGTNWIVLTKDDAIRRRPNEQAAIARYRVRVFCLTSGSLTGEEQRDRILANMSRIVQRSRQPGPYVCAIYAQRLRQVWP